MKVLNFGSLNLDYVYQVEHFVRPGETLSALSQQVNCGGKGLNQSIALAKAGARVWHAGCIGQGGELLAEMLRLNSVNTDLLEKVDALQGNAIIQVDSAGQNCILLFGGSNQCVSSAQIDRTLSAFSSGDYLVLQNEINGLPEIVEKAYEKGMVVVMNPSPYDEKLKQVDFGKLSWLLVNEVEAAQISGSTDPEDAWRFLHKAYPNLSVVITLGAEGSVCYGSKGRVKQGAFPVKAVDTTAAGDTFTGFFIAGIMEGLTVEQCMERAAAASAISVTREGAAPSIPTRAEVNELLREK